MMVFDPDKLQESANPKGLLVVAAELGSIICRPIIATAPAIRTLPK
jgi:hypothetical protein